MSGIVGMVSQLSVKEAVKQLTGVVFFGLGGLAFYLLMEGEYLSNDVNPKRARNGVNEVIGYWVDRVSLDLAQASFILTGLTTPLSVKLISTVIHRVFSEAQLEKVFGPNTVFEKNPMHPKHVCSLVGAALAIPAALRYFSSPPRKTPGETDTQRWAFISFLITRPTLHWGNTLAHRLLRIVR